jgi:predicted porin
MSNIKASLAIASCITLSTIFPFQAASAQDASSITIYGIIDSGVEYINGVAVGSSKESVARLSPSNQIASRWGLRGVEDLGGGLRAIFNLENGFAPDTGALLQNGRLFGRAAVVGLEGGWGGFLVGRQRNVIYDLSLVFDPLGYGTYGITAVDNAFFTQRPDNSIKYTYKAGGFSTSWLYSLGRDSLAGTPPGSQSEVPGNSKIGRQLGANVTYAGGPLNIGIGYDQQHGTTAALAGETDRRLFVAGMYDLAQTRLYAGFQRRHNDLTVPNTKNDMYWVGIKQPITAQWGVKGSIVHAKLKGSPNKSTLLGTSLYYDFSKRTEWYLNVGYATNSGTSTQGVTSSTPSLPGGNQTGVVTGIMHRF